MDKGREAEIGRVSLNRVQGEVSESNRQILLKAVIAAISSATVELNKVTTSAVSLAEDSATRVEGMVLILMEVANLLQSAVISSEAIATAVSANAHEVAEAASKASFAAQTLGTDRAKYPMRSLEMSALETAAFDARCSEARAVRESLRAHRAVGEFTTLLQQLEMLASQSTTATRSFIALAKSTQREVGDVLGAVKEMADLSADVR